MQTDPRRPLILDLEYLRLALQAEREKRRQLLALWREAMRLGGKKRG